MTKYWLMKSEPSVYPWSQLLKDKRTPWNGVRNYQANNNMKAMQLGDEAFFYHSNEERAIVGIMKVAKLWRLDPADETQRFGMVDMAPVRAVEKPVTLEAVKATKTLQDMKLVRQSRLSVSPVTAAEWKILLKMAEI